MSALKIERKELLDILFSVEGGEKIYRRVKREIKIFEAANGKIPSLSKNFLDQIITKSILLGMKEICEVAPEESREVEVLSNETSRMNLRTEKPGKITNSNKIKKACPVTVPLDWSFL